MNIPNIAPYEKAALNALYLLEVEKPEVLKEYKGFVASNIAEKMTTEKSQGASAVHIYMGRLKSKGLVESQPLAGPFLRVKYIVFHTTQKAKEILSQSVIS